jgi:hypothetical protein
VNLLDLERWVMVDVEADDEMFSVAPALDFTNDGMEDRYVRHNHIM